MYSGCRPPNDAARRRYAMPHLRSVRSVRGVRGVRGVGTTLSIPRHATAAFPSESTRRVFGAALNS